MYKILLIVIDIFKGVLCRQSREYREKKHGKVRFRLNPCYTIGTMISINQPSLSTHRSVNLERDGARRIFQ